MGYYDSSGPIFNMSNMQTTSDYIETIEFFFYQSEQLCKQITTILFNTIL